MSEEQLNNKLKTGNFETKSTSKYNIAVPKEEHLLTSAHNVKAMYISCLYNVKAMYISCLYRWKTISSTILGIISILDKLTDQFNLSNHLIQLMVTLMFLLHGHISSYYLVREYIPQTSRRL
jgi:hypothetical protein